MLRPVRNSSVHSALTGPSAQTRDLTMNPTSAEHWTGTATVNSCQPLSRQSVAVRLQITGSNIINSRGREHSDYNATEKRLKETYYSCI